MCKGLLTVCCVCLFLANSASADNVLLIVADDVGVPFIGSYGVGSDPPPTPFIDSLATNGVLFRNAWSNPVCSPTRAGILTGRHSFRTKVGTVVSPFSPWSQSLKQSEVILPEIVPGPSALIGKWHLDEGASSPNEHGWLYFSGTISGTVVDYFDWQKVTNGSVLHVQHYATSELVDDAIGWIQAQSSNTDWFLELSFQAAHNPIHAPPPELHGYDLTGLDPRTTPIPFYKAMVEAMDREIGRLLASVPADTTVIFVGDNGSIGDVSEPPYSALKGKATEYEGGVHVPFIVSGPIVANPGREVDALVHTVDLFATIAELLGASGSTGVDSVSIVPYLTNSAQLPIRDTVYTEQFYMGIPSLGDAAIRNSRYKLVTIFAPSFVEELYDLSADPLEEHNLLESVLTPDANAAYESLRAKMDSLRASDSRGGFLRRLLARLGFPR